MQYNQSSSNPMYFDHSICNQLLKSLSLGMCMRCSIYIQFASHAIDCSCNRLLLLPDHDNREIFKPSTSKYKSNNLCIDGTKRNVEQSGMRRGKVVCINAATWHASIWRSSMRRWNKAACIKEPKLHNVFWHTQKKSRLTSTPRRTLRCTLQPTLRD